MDKDTSEIAKLEERISKDPKSKLFVPLAEEYKKAGDIERSIQVLMEGLKNNPTYVTARSFLGRLLFEKGDMAGAQREFEEVAKSIPDNLMAQHKLGDLYVLQNRPADALKHYKTALSLNPGDEEMAALVSDIEAGRDVKERLLKPKQPAGEKHPAKEEPVQAATVRAQMKPHPSPIVAKQAEPVPASAASAMASEEPEEVLVVEPLEFEGEVLPGERYPEGPFGEYPGYCSGDKAPRPVIRINCVTHRNNPVFCVSAPGKPFDDTTFVYALCGSAALTRDLRNLGLAFKSVFLTPSRMAVIISTNEKYPGYVHTLSSAIWASKSGIYRPIIIVVGEDVDPSNADEVLWALTTRVHPVRDIHVKDRAPGSPGHPHEQARDQENPQGGVHGHQEDPRECQGLGEHVLVAQGEEVPPAEDAVGYHASQGGESDEQARSDGGSDPAELGCVVGVEGDH